MLGFDNQYKGKVQQFKVQQFGERLCCAVRRIENNEALLTQRPERNAREVHGSDEVREILSIQEFC
jgi:hypothetical protein